MGNERNYEYALRTVVSLGISLLVVAALLLSGCASAGYRVGGTEAASSSSSDASDAAAASDSGDAVVSAADIASMGLEYTDRDKDATYDEASATKIMLDQAGSAVDGPGAAADGSTVTITKEGTYVVSGSLADGQLVVETADTEKVQLVLDGASIRNEDGPAIYVKQTDKCFITLADGSENVLSDGSVYTLEDGSDEPYATLFSNDDLTINGSGALSVAGSYRHAVCSKDDLVITGGAYAIEAVEDGLRGRDCVKVLDGDFTVDAGGDCIKSNCDTDATRGFVSIDGGTFDLVAGDEGIQAVTYVRVAGGTLAIDAADDALHSGLDALIAGGDITIDAGDDAVHAETSLTIDGGTIDIRSCYEGYEAEKIYLNGGDTHIVADDDAVNASAAETPAGKTAAEASGADADADAAVDAGAIAGAEPPAGGEVPEGMSEGEAPAMLEGETPADGTVPEAPDGAQGGWGAGGAAEDANERMRNGGAPDNAFAEGMGIGGGVGGMTMGDENCLIQITGGYIVLEASGDAVDSNGSVEVTGGVLLVTGPTSNGDGAFDYDLSATVTGGTVLMVGSAGMAQNFTSGEQPFSFNTASGSAGQSVAIVDESGAVLASYTPTKQFGMVLASSPAFAEGGSYELVIGGTVAGANADGYADSSSVSGGTSTAITASTTATGGMGGLGAGGRGAAAGIPGDVRNGMRQ